MKAARLARVSSSVALRIAICHAVDIGTPLDLRALLAPALTSLYYIVGDTVHDVVEREMGGKRGHAG